MRVFLALVVCAAALRLRTAEQQQANPIRRIVQLLQKMQSEVQAEGKKEQKLYEKFHCFCQNGAGKLTKEMSEGQAEIASLKADGKSQTARKQGVDADLVQHKKDRAEAQDAVKEATGIREKEKADFDALIGDMKTNLDALNGAINVISKGMGKAFLQAPANRNALKRAVSAGRGVEDMEKEAVLSFISSPFGDHQAASGEIVGILKEMKDEMDRDFNGAISKEEAAVKAFKELVAAKEAEISDATSAIERKTVLSGELAVSITETKAAAEAALKEFNANEQFLMNMDSDCKTKKSEYEARVEERSQELLAISEAIKVLNDDDALDIFKKTLPGQNVGTALIQVSSRDSMRKSAFAYVQSAQVLAQSPQLGLIAMMLRSGAVDFSKVLKMIDDMVAHLGKEQKDDDDQLEYCQSNLNRAGDEKVTLQRDIKDLNAAIDALEARMEELKAKIESLNNRMADTEKAMKEATAQRQEENAAFQQSQTELTAATQLLNKAKNRLFKFYNPKMYKAPAPRELTEEERIAQNMGEVLPTEAPKYIAGTKIEQLQTKPAEAPATWEGGYKKSKSSSGVIALMDMMIKDVEMQLESGSQDEATAQRDYEKLMSEAKNSLAADTTARNQAESSHAEAASDRASAKSDRTGKNDELMAKNKEIAELHGACDFLIENFDFRKAARTNEVEALKNAKAVLSGAKFS